jgi:transcriptional regulator
VTKKELKKTDKGTSKTLKKIDKGTSKTLKKTTKNLSKDTKKSLEDIQKNKPPRMHSALQIANAAGVSVRKVSEAFSKHAQDAKVGAKYNINHPYIFKYLTDKGADLSQDKLVLAKKKFSKRATSPINQSESKYNKARATKNPKDISTVKIKSPTSEHDRIKNSADNKQNPNAKIDGLPDLPEFGSWTLNEIMNEFGTIELFREELDAKNKYETAREKEIKNKKLKGELISRDFVKKTLIGFLEELTSRLLVDSAPNIVARLYTHAAAADSHEIATTTARRELSKPIKHAKEQIIKQLTKPDPN